MKNCPYCRKELPQDAPHCPNCLKLTHTECASCYEPVSIWVKSEEDMHLILRCKRCGEMITQPIMPNDNPLVILSVAARPLAQPPFPIEMMEELTKIMGGTGDLRGYYEQREQKSKV